MTIKAIKPGPKRISTSTGKPDQQVNLIIKKLLATHHHYNHQNQQQKNRIISL